MVDIPLVLHGAFGLSEVDVSDWCETGDLQGEFRDGDSCGIHRAVIALLKRSRRPLIPRRSEGWNPCRYQLVMERMKVSGVTARI